MSNGSATAGNGAAATGTGEDNITALPNPSLLENLETDFVEDPNDINLQRYQDEKLNSWYPDLDEYVNGISEECIRHSTMHAETSKLYNKRHQIVTISVILVSFLTTTLALFPIPAEIVKVSVGFLGAVGILVGSLNKVMKFQEKSLIHRLSSDKYMTLNSTIVEQFLLPPKVRFNGVLFERWCRRQFFTLKRLAPYPDKKISKQLSRPVGGNVPMPPMEGGEGNAHELEEVVVVPKPGELEGDPGSGSGSVHEELGVDENGNLIEPLPVPILQQPPVVIPVKPTEDAYSAYLAGRGKRFKFMADHDSPF